MFVIVLYKYADFYYLQGFTVKNINQAHQSYNILCQKPLATPLRCLCL